VWNAAKQELVGAYRIQTTDAAPNLYTHTLFQYGQRFLERLGPALELGRSFVRPEYQRGFAPLLLLWKGIGKLVAREPRYKTLFGPVSISHRYSPPARELMLSFLQQHREADWSGLVEARHAPPEPRFDIPCDDLEELSDAVSDVTSEAGAAGVPVLLRQYLRLGGHLLSFSIDPAFSNTLDGLIVVDLTRTDLKLLERYLGRSEATAFLSHHASHSAASTT
jgi:putative hemolysin